MTETKRKSALFRTADFLFDFVETFAWAIFAVLVVFTFAMRLCTVDGQSMENTLRDKQQLLLFDVAYTPAQDDIVVFHMTEGTLQKKLIKRVIATEGQTVEIRFSTGEIFVDGVQYADTHATLKTPYTEQITGVYSLKAGHHYDTATDTFQATVPEGCVFVMGDNRNNSLDSRSTTVGFVDSRCVLGKVFLRFSPFTLF